MTIKGLVTNIYNLINGAITDGNLNVNSSSSTIKANFSGTNTQEYDDGETYNGIVVLNLSSTVNLTVTVNGIVFTVPVNSSFEGDFDDFTSITITVTSGSYEVLLKGV